MVNVVTQYRCSLCGALRPSFAAAKACEDQGIKTLPNDPQVGDIVECGSCGWWRGDLNWFTPNTGEFHGKSTGSPKAVVVDRRLKPDQGYWGHVLDYILFTPSYATGESQVLRTSVHHTPAKIVGKATPEDSAAYQEAAALEMKSFSVRLA